MTWTICLLMAGIVASTLRRKAFHKKLPVDNRYQIVETHISQSPESHGSPSSPGFKARIGAARAPKGAKLCHEDFWPSCTSLESLPIHQATFETFELVEGVLAFVVKFFMSFNSSEP